MHFGKHLTKAVILVAAGLAASGASAYDRVTITNRTEVNATGTTHFAACRSEDYSVAPGKTWTGGGRGLCLLTKITMKPAGKPVTEYTSSGTSYSQFLITGTVLGHRVWSEQEYKANPQPRGVPASVSSQPFYNIAHMTNTSAAVDWAVGQGANAVEMDLHYNDTGPTEFRHGGVCDCSCVPLLPPAGHVCTVLAPAGNRCEAREEAGAQLRHVATKGLALVYIDNKIDGKTKAELGASLVRFLVTHLFERGHPGIAVVGGIEETTAFMNAAAKEAKGTKYADRIYIAMDEFGTSKTGTAGLIQKLVSQVDTRNRIYGTGLTSCSPTQYYREVDMGAANHGAGVVSTTYIWTVDSEASMTRYINLGARGMITNRPAALRAFLARHGIAQAPASYRPPQARSDTAVR